MVNKQRIFLILLSFSLLLGQVFGQETLIQDRAYSGRIFKAYLRTSIPYSRDLEVEWEQGEASQLKLTRDPYIRPYNALTNNQGDRVYEDMVEVVLSLTAPEGGIFYCTDLRLYRENFELIMPPFPLIVHSRDEGNLDFPLELYWSKTKEVIYPGEAVPLILNTRYTESLDFPEEIKMGKTTMGNLEEVDLTGSIETISINGTDVYAYPIESWFFTATEPGEVDFPGGIVTIKGLKREIPPLTFQVKPLPAQVQLSGGVGRFHMESGLSHQIVKPGQIVTLTLRIIGVGNFHFFNFPEVRSEGFELINSSEREELIPTEEGYEGFREREYRFQAGKDSSGQLTIDSFSWVTQGGLVKSVDKKSFSLQIEAPQEGDKISAQILMEKDLKNIILKEKLSGSVKWFFIIPGALFFIISLFLLNKGEDHSTLALLVMLPLLLSMGWEDEQMEQIQRAEILFEEGQYEQSLGIYRVLYEKEKFAAYQYNMGIIRSLMGELVEGELLIRSALLALPGDRILIEGLGDIELKNGLEDQYSLQWKLSSYQLSWFIVILSNLLFFFLALYFKNKRVRLLLLLSTLTLLLLLSLGGSVLLDWSSSRPQGVIDSMGGDLVKVPEQTAEKWLDFRPGTVVRIKIEKQGYYFIETGYGLDGWLKINQLRVVEEGYY